MMVAMTHDTDRLDAGLLWPPEPNYTWDDATAEAA